MERDIPLGIKLVCWVYVVNIFLFILSLALFMTRILVLGAEAGPLLSLAVRLWFVCIPAYLWWGLRELKKSAFFLGVFFHIFFLINNLSGYLEYKGLAYSIIHISGYYGSSVYSPAQLFVFALNTLLNIALLVYLFKQRRIFG